jgi:hypothetical protein
MHDHLNITTHYIHLNIFKIGLKRILSVEELSGYFMDLKASGKCQEH